MKKLMLLLVVMGMVAPAAMALTNAHSGDFGCGTCHNAHNKNAVTGVPLWGRAASTEVLAGYTITGGRTNLTGAQGLDLAGSSMLCMSCHDGVTNTSGTGSIADDQAAGYIDTTVMHPVSFTYNATGVDDTVYFKPATDDTAVGNLTLYGGNMECGTCHDIHATNTNASAMREATADAMCSTCHVK